MSTIKLKRSGETGSVPSPDDLVQGELSINYADNKLFALSHDNVTVVDLLEIGERVGVATFNGLSGDVFGVGSFNGLTGAVQGVSAWNGLTGNVDVTNSVIHVGGISAGSGATFAGLVNFEAGISADGLTATQANLGGVTFAGGEMTVGDIWITEDSVIKVQGDTESILFNGNGGQFTLSANAVDIGRDLRHSGDADTELSFNTNDITIQAGGYQFLHGTSSGVGTLNVGGVTFGTGGGATFGGNIVLQNNDYISNPSAYTVRMMPEGTSATDYGLEFEFSDWGWGSVITNRRASDGANAGSVKFDSPVLINSDTDLTFGSNSHSRMRWTTTGNNTLQIGVKSTDTVDDCSGSLALIHSSHFGQAYRSPGVTHDNPNLYVYSYNTDANDYIRFEHDGTDANIVTGAGDISLQPASGVVEIIAGITASGGVTFAGNVTASTFVGALTGNVTGNVSGSAATVTTAEQEEITSLGTLTELTMGGELSCVDNLVTRPVLKDIAETVNAIGTITGDTAVNFAAGNVQTVTGNGNCEFTFTNPPASGKAGTVTLIITNGGANTTTWHSSVKWPGNNAPALTSSGVDIVSFTTIDAGTTIYGFIGGINFS